MLKSELRQEIKVRKCRFTADGLREQSLAIVRKVLDHPRIGKARTILLYHSMPNEVDTHDLIDRLYRQGKTVLLPVTLGDDLEIRRYEGPQRLRESHAFHIMEPVGEAFADLQSIELVIVPGVAFDGKGNRLGRGHGYYDRFLRQVPQAYKLGLCFGFQMMETVPVGPTDVAMDEVLCG